MADGFRKLPRAVEGGADADLGAAGGDGGGEVVAHAHGEFAEGDAEAGGEVVAKGAEIRKCADGVFRGFGRGGTERSDGHETVETQVLFCQCELDQARSVGEIGAEFGGVVAGVDLKEDGENFAEFGGGAVEVVEEFFAVDALDAVEVLGGEFGFVGLKMADEFPSEGGGGAERAFLGGFLDAIFTDGA
jgi:hypothetical protein